MRRIIAFSLLFLSVFVVYGAAECDSIKVFFALNKAIFDPTRDNDAASMKKFIDGISVAANSGRLDNIRVYGYASPEGPLLNNNRLSRERCRVIAEYISRQAGVPLNDIQTYPGGVAWDGLRTLVTGNLNTPSREEVLHVLDKYMPDASTDRAMSDQCMKSLMAIDEGRTYNWMLENLFPELRFSLAVYTYNTPDSSIVQPVPDNVEPDSLPISSEDLPEPISTEENADTIPAPPIFENNNQDIKALHRFAVKTNLLYDAALLPNLEVEWHVSDNWSVALEGGIAWWGDQSKERSYRLVMFSPEVKRWIRPRAPWNGFYAGLFAGGGYYDFEKGSPGYRGEGVMGGLSVGYMWPVSHCLSLEAAIGAGYLYTRYKEYKLMDGHHVYQRTKDLNYFGPLKVKFSLVWRLWDLNKRKRQNDETVVRYEK